MADVLIADDDRDYLSAFQAGLEQLGHTVDCVTSADALRALLRKDRFDVVFLDVVMPGGGAVTLVHEISAEYPELPIIVISGHSELHDSPLLREGMRMARAILRKTASLREIDDAIRYAID